MTTTQTYGTLNEGEEVVGVRRAVPASVVDVVEHRAGDLHGVLALRTAAARRNAPTAGTHTHTHTHTRTDGETERTHSNTKGL